ncbi:mevalonate kinase-like [Nylanderia fulva]|uniref:mevalonate kinase-like n=1 Tax=Nylanderia fulva TaxID=613905 RepID=UPI0010FB6819|nr:mevalonate kinase-like [Nylanderia fulva]
MANFKISAPGRIVLSGEHSAMYGKKFVVAGLNLRTRLEFQELPESERYISINFSRIDLRKNIPVETIESYFFNTNLSDMQSSPMDFFRYVTYFITMHCLWETLEQRFSLHVFFYLFYFFTYDLEKRSPFRISVTTEIPLGNGLGSSTSFAACLAGCFLHWKSLQRGNHIRFNRDDLVTIKRYTESCEDFMQEYVLPPIDAYTCIYGQVQYYQHKRYKYFVGEVTNLQTVLKVLVIATNIRQDKKERALQIAVLNSKASDFKTFMNSLDDVALTIYDRLAYINNIRNIENPIDYQNAYKNLQSDIIRNQQLLKKYHLSQPDFDTISEIASQFEYGAKLTGFAGGFAYIVLRPNLTDVEIQHLQEQFTNKNFTTKIATIDCAGLTIDI